MTGSCSSNASKSGVDEREIGREDLQLMLRPRLGERVQVLGVQQSSLLPPGENFACSIYKLDARVNVIGGQEDDEEELHLVAKLYPYDEVIQDVFDFKLFFKKEIFFYDKLVPVLKELADRANEPPLEVAPEFFGFRLSVDPKIERVDEGVVVLMDNLQSKGYYTGNKIEGLDLEHTRATIETLASFHAYNVACKQHRPDFFNNEARAHAVPVPYKAKEDFDLVQLLLDMMFADERLARLRELILKFLGGSEGQREAIEYVAQEPWLSFTHLDFWTNNVLFKKEGAKVVDVKFLDFQNYVYNSPLRDLPYFLCTSTTHEVITGHFNELLDLYYDTFVATLKKLRCDASLFTRESFNRQIKIDARLEFFHNILAIKFFTAEIDKRTYDPSQLEEVVLCSQINKLGLDKWYQIVLTYIEQGWM
ncbi:uncharacterized protein LOC106639836 [Copidosoma floridanum]|uniref:uncharacterized protein LOC106639836 n=1 Tax=Copidosoma floridanum TaxID=29053 RepID=UPI0006C94FF5|nr:uncharacterized protein LOC106639836 [Copidosoma floridanum]